MSIPLGGAPSTRARLPGSSDPNHKVDPSLYPAVGWNIAGWLAVAESSSSLSAPLPHRTRAARQHAEQENALRAVEASPSRRPPTTRPTPRTPNDPACPSSISAPWITATSSAVYTIVILVNTAVFARLLYAWTHPKP